MVRGGAVGIMVPLDRATEPTKPLRLVRVIVVVPVRPEPKLIVVGLIVKPKSVTITLSLTVPARVSGFPSESLVA